MKKKSIAVFFSVLLVDMRIYAVDPVTGTSIGIVSAVTAVYAIIPNAGYAVCVYERGKPEILTYDSANIALAAKDLALYKGAEKVVIKSKYYTIHSGCNGTYYPDGTYKPD